MKIFNVGNKLVNIYLLDTGTHRLLIDTGFPAQLNELGRAMRKTGYTIQDIHYVLVTHFHVDHAGAVQELKNEGVQFLLFGTQAASIAPMEKMTIPKWKYTPLRMDDNLILPVAETRNFLQSLGAAGQVIETPGHSADSISLLLDSGETFTGDLPAAFLLTDKASVEKISWTLLKNMGAKIVYPGHGTAWSIRNA